LDNFESLLYRESFLEKFQNKWRKNISDGNISVNNQLYTIKVTDNKRKLIYDENNKLINSVPYVINDNKEIITS
jgi:hypothetical protein